MSTRSVTKWLNKARRISNTISDLKEEDREEWTRDYFSGTRTAVGPRFQNLGKYLSTRRQSETADRRVRGLGETIKKQYRTMATARVSRIDEIEAEELASRILQAETERIRLIEFDPVWREARAWILRTNNQAMYEPGVEMRLREEELSIEEIEADEDLGRRRDRYEQRREHAQQILGQILAEADAHRAAVARTAAAPASPPTMRARHRAALVGHDHYDSDEGWGRKHKKKKPHKNKTKKNQRKRNGKSKTKVYKNIK